MAKQVVANLAQVNKLMAFMPSGLSKMNNDNLASQAERWEVAMNRIETIDYGTEVIKSVVESFKEPSDEMIRIDDLEAFLEEMEGFA